MALAALPSALKALPLRSSTCSCCMPTSAGEMVTMAAGVKQHVTFKQVSPISACNAAASAADAASFKSS